MYRLYKRRGRNWLRLAQIASMVMASLTLVSGVSYALLQSQLGILRGNTIQTAIANLQLSSDGTNFTNSLEGYNFGSLIPGGMATPTNGYPVYLKNVGTTPLAVKLSIPTGFTNPNNVDLSKVHLILSPIGGGAGQNITLQALVDAANSGGVALTQATHIIPTQVIGYNLQISMETDVINGPTASLGNVEFDFGGTAVS